MRLNTVKYLTTLVFIVGALQVNTVLAQMDHGEMQMQGGKAPGEPAITIGMLLEPSYGWHLRK